MHRHTLTTFLPKNQWSYRTSEVKAWPLRPHFTALEVYGLGFGSCFSEVMYSYYSEFKFSRMWLLVGMFLYSTFKNCIFLYCVFIGYFVKWEMKVLQSVALALDDLVSITDMPHCMSVCTNDFSLLCLSQLRSVVA